MPGRLLLAMLALACAATGVAAHTPRERSAAELMDVLMWNREPIGGPFALVDQHGQQRTEKDLRGKLTLVYFGYTTCTDICPADLQQIGAAVTALGAEGDAVQPVFITLDPARDTQQRMAAYVANFHARMMGLRGSEAAVHRAADAYRVYYRKVAVGNGGDYAIDHAAAVYLMDRDGKYVGYFPPGTSAARMVQMIQPHLARP